MRSKTAVSFLLVGVLLMLAGISQLTFWSPPETVTAGVPAGAQSGPVTVIDAGAKEPDAEDIDITVRAEGTFTLAVGRAGDVDAWVGEAAHLRVTGIAEGSLRTTFTGSEETVPDPSGADLWTSEETADGAVTHRWLDPAEGEWSILLAADGENPAPTDISLTWPNEESTPWAVPLIVAGALAVVLGIALFFVAPRAGRRRPAAPGSRAYQRRQDAKSGSARSTSTGARRGGARRGAAPFRAAAVVALALSASGPTAAQAATSEPATTEPATSESAGTEPTTTKPAAGPEEAAGPPVLLESQLERILDAVGTVVAKADAASNAELLEPRVGGAALTLRSASYAVSSRATDVPQPTPVASEPILTSMVPSGLGWPRTVVALTQNDANPVPQALVLVQDDPRSNYRLGTAIQMLPGTTFPVSGGAAGLQEVPLEDTPDLSLSPQDAMGAIADFLSTPDGDNAGTFEANSFADAITAFQSDVVADPGNESADITFVHEAVPANTHALYTGDGGAMVFGYLDHTYSSVPRGPRDLIDLEGTVYESLTGEESTEEGIDVRYGEAVMMYVPAAGSSERISVIGAAQQLLSAELR